MSALVSLAFWRRTVVRGRALVVAGHRSWNSPFWMFGSKQIPFFADDILPGSVSHASLVCEGASHRLRREYSAAVMRDALNSTVGKVFGERRR